MAVWSMTLLSVWDEVQLIAQDETDRWGETERNALVNSVVAQIAKDTRCLMQSATQSLVAGQAGYALPTACPGIQYVRRVYVSGNLAEPVDVGELDYYERDGIELDTGRTRWYARAGQIALTPAPTEAVTNGLVVHYAGLPETISADADPIPLPADLEFAVVLGCARRVLGADGRKDEALYREKLYREEIGKFLLKGGEWQERRQQNIIDTEDDGLPVERRII